MADSRLETSLHPVHDLALLSSSCAAVIRMRTNERQTRVISQKQLAWWPINLGRGRDLVSRVAACTKNSSNYCLYRYPCNACYKHFQIKCEQIYYSINTIL